MIYPQVVRYLNSFINYEKLPAYPYKKSLKLERIRGFLETIGNPQESIRAIHVAGSKGKGSTCAFIAYVLRNAGYTVGLYTSPHLYDFRERIRILRPLKKRIRNNPVFEGVIPKKWLIKVVIELKPAIDSFNKNSQYGALSFFEVYTALAFHYFNKKKVDFTVLETGLGGRLDATNVIKALACAITPISYEHTQKLGNTLSQIAHEKAGIIKTKEAPVIVAPQHREAQAVIRRRCILVKTDFLEVGRHIKYKKNRNSFSVTVCNSRYSGLKIRLLGEHQLVNASVAVGLIWALRRKGIIIKVASVRQGLYDASWPGRCEVIHRHPLLVLDGAQNSASAKAIKRAVIENFDFKRIILVFGISKDKDINGVCSQLKGLADAVVLTRADNPRAESPHRLKNYFDDKQVYITDNVEEAKLTAKRLAGLSDLILVTGSLFVVGEFRNGKHRIF